ncbi:hypothetical protein Desor_5509 [Desulfosporosinus orientis DSM 765]|uniref:RsgI N-terminal anti-sigma domain-containing protein n=1 Tax=Desulfosporosinus orientis (strain ATCC 19365 / DSM 765 / NCIMB 8382 / VKM B-1628 / Singapore I) TaxID=768706 RepID=G7WGF1_DESOD|nr:anti-sigma factor domain-containing protein [Desulfosporosinus orientis]AET70883.1 hypothetical protein Desor_5509 [Desulfosporosinus orientis DSM 765]
MNKSKAVIIEKDGYRCTVLCDNGAFRHVYRFHHAEVGEEILIRNGIESFGGGRAWIGAAVIFFMVFTTLIGWNLYQAPTAAALVSVDINPSIQFSVDDQGNLLSIDTQNKDAEQLLSKTDLKGKPIDKVLEQFVSEAAQQQLIDPELPWIVVGYSSLANDSSEQVDGNLNESQIVSCLTENAQKNGLKPRVAFFTLTSQERELAQKGHLTLGEYALWQTAIKAGVITPEEELNNTTERIRLLEDPKVQAQVEEDRKEHESSASLPQPEHGKAVPEKSNSEKDNLKKEQDKNKDKGKEEDHNEPSNPSFKGNDRVKGSDSKEQHSKMQNPMDKKQGKDIEINRESQEQQGKADRLNNEQVDKLKWQNLTKDSFNNHKKT